VNLERHHRRIHWKARAIHWGLIPLALCAAPAWLYLSYGACQEDGDAIGSACRVFRVIPFLPTLGALALLVLIVADLIEIGREAHREQHGVRPKAHIRHAAHGFRAIGEKHQSHIHLALLTAAAVTLALGAWIALLAYQSTH
jgi:hypothetical protein